MTTITSIDAQFTQAQIRKSSSGISESAANLSSGQKLNANVADLSVGTVLRTRVATLRTTVINAGQAKSLLSTAQGALETIGELLGQQKSLATTAAGDALTSNERGFLNQEFQAITAEIDRIADNTNFNGKSLIDGSISGQAALNSVSGETIENNTLLATSDFALGGVIASGDLVASASAATFTASASVGTSATSTVLNFTQGASSNASTVVIDGNTINFTATASDDAATATAFVDAVRAYQLANDDSVRNFVFVDNLNGSVTVTAANNGTGSDALTFNGTGSNLVVEIGSAGADIIGVDRVFNLNASINQGELRANTGTFNEDLLGGVSNISATISAAGDEVFSATFTAEVNGTTYTSQPVYLLDNGAGGGYILQADQVITFEDRNGPVDTNGVLTDNTFNLVVGAADVSVAGTGLATLQDSINTIADGFETQLVGAKFTQDRNPNLEVVSTTDDTLVNSLSTFLNGIQGYDVANDVKGDIVFRTDGFGNDDAGSIGSVGSFDFNKDTGVLTTTLDGVTYTANLTQSSEPADGSGFITVGGGAAGYSTATGTLTLDSGTIVLTTADTTDARQIRIDLTNVNADTFDVLGDEGEVAFEDAFNTLFGVAANDSLSFQVGASATDSIGVSLGSAKSSALYLDSDNITQSLDITTLANAQTASSVLDNAINANVALISDVKATITRFDSAIENNLTSIQNADAARSNLLDTDFSAESTTFAEQRVRQDAAVSVLAQLNQRIQNLLQLLR